jgi:proline iminopeptidase
LIENPSGLQRSGGGSATTGKVQVIQLEYIIAINSTLPPQSAFKRYFTMAQTVRRSYKHVAPFDSGFLNVGSIHKLHYEQYGNKDGKPSELQCMFCYTGLELISTVVFLHGGPGGSTSLRNTIYFNPSVYRVILFDQRGCGQSLPLGEIRENSLQYLVSDIEVLRKHFGLQRLHVFGASWGSTISLLYAQTHPEAVASLTLRGIPLFEVQEKPDFNESFRRTRDFHPELYEELIGHLTEEERKDIAGSYTKRFSCGDHAVELAAMKIYDRWAGVMSKLIPKEDDSDVTMTEAEEKHMIASNRIECHYHAHILWLKDMQYLEPKKLEKIKNIPCSIVNGRYDLLCPPNAAWRLHKALPKSKLFIIPDAGHSAAVRSRSMLHLF